ncbi:trafficking protein particle complex subunit 5, putative [Ichthyophthirius multifiliis]|uniref:Trafficking protein particle complex subunit 5, putative n=1 Tax=Ichthyophthirius multifiliis TaxID=5932 RepID=G0R4L8_ICHMU|nr:trafficking protein particle complex subunit 5, putative [Ichthyophthirius multifiliis]EGR27578.1 trafficking protein particle complex subunit 5, putative [Ichthyophthirius multifiliis]|eukprot:XP_004025030.1 trafficking protein particle complex subunit 5, putative [Ichthyophthirius multifiliis]
MGESIGVRMIELIYCREKRLKKESKHIEILQFISSAVWKSLFGKNADGITTAEGEQYGYFIKDYNPLILKYISEDERIGGAALIVGIIKGILNHTGFDAQVYYSTVEGQDDKEKYISMYPATHFFIKFEPWVVEREK